MDSLRANLFLAVPYAVRRVPAAAYSGQRVVLSL